MRRAWLKQKICSRKAKGRDVATLTAKTLIARIRKSGRKARSYSGRYMYGRHCVGVDLDRHDAGGELPKGANTDSMGLGSIWYWPAVAWPENMQDDE